MRSNLHLHWTHLQRTTLLITVGGEPHVYSRWITHKPHISRLWALEELGIEYDHKPYSVRSPEAMEHSPTGKLPALIAEGEVITDSAAIITFLADRHGGLTFPQDRFNAQNRTHLHRVNDEIDAVLWTAARHSFILPEAERVPAVKDSLKLNSRDHWIA